MGGELSPVSQVMAALEAGIVTMLVSNPLQVLRTRLVLATHHTQPSTTLATILQREGLGALFRGFSPNLIGVTHGTVQMVLYDQLKQR